MAIHRDMAALTIQYSVDEILADLRTATIPATRIFDIWQVRAMSQLKDHLTWTTTPDGRAIGMQPMAVDLSEASRSLPFPPKYGADTRRILGEAGVNASAIDALMEERIVAG